MNNNFINFNGLAALPTSSTAPNMVIIRRNPTPTDWQNFYLGTFWLNPVNESIWYLASLAGNVATWLPFGGSGGAVVKLTGDIGTALPDSTGNINIEGTTTAGRTVRFDGTIALHTLELYTSDAKFNTAIGNEAGNTGVGSNNTALGYEALGTTGTGSNNVGIGYQTGSAYTTTESNNILIGSSVAGTATESNVLRIGNGTGTGTGELANAYISGIEGVNVGSTANVVTAAGDHLGTAVITAGANVTVSTSANVIEISATGALTPGVTSAFLAYLSTNQSLSANTPTTVEFDTVLFDVHSDYNNSTFMFTAPFTGYYEFNFITVYATGTVATSVYSLITTSQTYTFPLGNAGYELVVPIPLIAHMTAGDTAYVQVTFNTVSGSNTIIGSSTPGTLFSGVFLFSSGMVGNSILGTAYQNIGSTAGKTWSSPYGVSSSTQAQQELPMAHAGTISNLYVNVVSNASTADTTVTVNKNGVNTAIVATITASTTGIFSDTTHSVSFAAGDLIQFELSQATTGNVEGAISVSLAA